MCVDTTPSIFKLKNELTDVTLLENAVMLK
jgi:hypothetical protein